jgi:hypothetical protein
MGEELFAQLTAATGLPKDAMSAELDRLLAKAGVAKEKMTLEDLRRVLAEYVQDILLSAKSDLNKKKAVGE